MLIHPAMIVAFVLYLLVGPLTVSQRFQTQFKCLGHGVHQKLFSILSPPRATFRLQDRPVTSVATFEALPITPVETSVIHPAEIIGASQVPLEDNGEVVTHEAYSTQHNDHPSPTPVRAFVVSSEYRDLFPWRDLLNYRVFGALAVAFFSFWFSLVMIPFVFKLLSRSDFRDEAEPTALPILLPPKILAPPATTRIQISNLQYHAPLEPIFSTAPQEFSAFWLAPEQKQQGQTSSPTLPLLRLRIPAFENESQKKPSLPTSPVDSGYGTTPPETLAASSPTSSGSITTSPEHPVTPLLAADAESTLINGSDNVTTSPGDFAEDSVDTAGFDLELGDDDDDGSITVTNSIVNLVDLTTRSALPPAEELAAKLEHVTATLIEEAESLSEPLTEEVSVIAPHSDDSTADLPFHDEPPSDTADATVNPSCVDEMTATGTDLKTGETQAEVDFPAQDDLWEDVESWIPNYEVPAIFITPPSDVDPEEYPLRFDSEDEQESEDLIGLDFEDGPAPAFEHNESVFEYADNYPEQPAGGVIVELPPSPVNARDSPFRSPITKSGMLWSDDEGEDPGPLPRFGEVAHIEVFDHLDSPAVEIHEVTETEAQDFPIGEERSDTIVVISKDSTASGTTQQLTQEPRSSPEVSVREVAEPTPTELAPSTSVSLRPQSPSRTSRTHRIHNQASSDNRARGEGSGQCRRSLEAPRPQYFHCCKLSKSDGRPKSWENWKVENPAACIPKRTSLQEWQFVCPTDKDGENPTTRIAIDNLDADRFRTLDGLLSYNYLTEAMGFFSTTSYRCWRGRAIEGIEYSSVGYATVDFESVGEAVRMFNELQGRRFRGHTWHWRLEFVDPRDESHGGRKIVRAELVPDSVKQALAAELEASTRNSSNPSRSDDTTGARSSTRTRPRLSVGGRSLLIGAMSNVVQDRRTVEQPTKSAKRVPSRRPYSRS